MIPASLSRPCPRCALPGGADFTHACPTTSPPVSIRSSVSYTRPTFIQTTTIFQTPIRPVTGWAP